MSGDLVVVNAVQDGVGVILVKLRLKEGDREGVGKRCHTLAEGWSVSVVSKAHQVKHDNS